MALCMPVAKAQRHSTNIQGIEISGAKSLNGYSTSLNFTNYTSRKGMYKIGVFGSYNKEVLYKDESSSYIQYAASAEYLYSVYNNNKNVYFNMGAGILVGYEDLSSIEKKYNNPTAGYKTQMKSGFVSTPFISVETEIFISKTAALVIGAKQGYSPLSNINKLNTSFSIGFKKLFF